MRIAFPRWSALSRHGQSTAGQGDGLGVGLGVGVGFGVAVGVGIAVGEGDGVTAGVPFKFFT